MAISAYTGLMGSGKSYNAVANVLIPAFKEGRKVYTNIPLDLELIKQHFDCEPIQFTIEEIQENEAWFDSVDNGSIVVIDECWELWPAGTTSKNIRLDQKEFLTKHRHKVGENGKILEPVFVTQDLSQIASFVRNLVNTTYHHVKQDQIGQDKRFRVDVYSGAVTGQKPPVKRRIREFYGKYSEDVYRYYHSQTQSESTMHGNEQSTDKRANILKSPMMLFYAVAPILLMLFVVFVGYPTIKNSFGGSDLDNPTHETIEKPDSENLPLRPAPRPVFKKSQLTPQQIAVKEFLNKSEIFISYSEFYRFSIKQKGTYFYSFSFESNQRKSLVKQFKLEDLGVTVLAVNDCLAFLLYEGQQFTAQCMEYKDKDHDGSLGLAEASSAF